MPNIKHTFSSSVADGGDGSLIQPSYWNAEQLIETYLDWPTLDDSVAPSAPTSASTLRVYAEFYARRGVLEMLNSAGRSFPMARAPWYGGTRVWSGSSGAGVTINGMPQTTTGTATNPAASIGNLMSMSSRVQITSSSLAASAAGIRANQAVVYGGGAAVSTGSPGGYFFAATVGTPVIVASSTNGFVGLLNGTGAITPGTAPHALTSCVGFGFGTGASIWAFYNGSAASPAASTALTGFDVSASAWYSFYIYCPPATSGSAIYWQAQNMHTGAVSSGSVTSPIPNAASLLAPQLYIGSTGAGSKAISFGVVYLETDW